MPTEFFVDRSFSTQESAPLVSTVFFADFITHVQSENVLTCRCTTAEVGRIPNIFFVNPSPPCSERSMLPGRCRRGQTDVRGDGSRKESTEGERRRHHFVLPNLRRQTALFALTTLEKNSADGVGEAFGLIPIQEKEPRKAITSLERMEVVPCCVVPKAAVEFLFPGQSFDLRRERERLWLKKKLMEKKQKSRKRKFSARATNDWLLL